MNKASSEQKIEGSKSGKSKNSQSQKKSVSTGNKHDKVKDEDGILGKGFGIAKGGINICDTKE